MFAGTEGHILEDVNKCVLALQQRDADMFDRTAGAIRGRCSRVSNVVSAEMFNYAPGPYTDHVMQTVTELRDRSEYGHGCSCVYLCYMLTKLMFLLLLGRIFT